MRDTLKARVAAAIDAGARGELGPDARDALLRDLARWQADGVAPYGRLVGKHDARGVDPLDWPALPTDVFRHVRVARHAPSLDACVFRTSGTTSGQRGEHPLRDLELYDRAAEAAARLTLFREGAPLRLVMLAPHPDEAPDSSLSYMLGRFEAWFGTTTDWVFPLDERLERALDEAGDAPVALLGTSFAFVHAEDLLDRRFALAPGSRVMQTGGFKGRSREVAPDALRRAIAERYGVPEPSVVAEYGMTELSSQMYERVGADTAGRLWVPPWVRARVVDPESLADVPDGARGILRIDDPANLDSVSAIQTSDLAIRHGAAIELLGRAPGAVPRGCSLSVEEALG
ncbi:MAG: acyl-protein synthetase [Sandaracinaceae bacterium]|nr:acyl-protein synthetase [Sandaracinaceae bacterium]